MSKFVTTVLANLNKSEDVKQQEFVQSFVDDAVIEVNTQIAQLSTSTLPSLKLKLTREQKSLEKAQKAFEVAKYSTASNFEQYLQNRSYAKNNVADVKDNIADIQAEITQTEAQLTEFQEILKDLTAE